MCTEETVSDIQDRYIAYNGHAASYTWKRLTEDGEKFVPLDMNKTLEENGVLDEDLEFEKVRACEQLRWYLHTQLPRCQPSLPTLLTSSYVINVTSNVICYDRRSCTSLITFTCPSSTSITMTT